MLLFFTTLIIIAVGCCIHGSLKSLEKYDVILVYNPDTQMTAGQKHLMNDDVILQENSWVLKMLVTLCEC